MTQLGNHDEVEDRYYETKLSDLTCFMNDGKRIFSGDSTRSWLYQECPMSDIRRSQAERLKVTGGRSRHLGSL